MPKKKLFIERKKVLMETWDDSKDLEDDSEKKNTHMELMASA